MLSFHKVGIPSLVSVLFAGVAAAQTANPTTSPRESLWNGTVIGLGAGIGSATALDKTTVRLSPIAGRARKGVMASLVLPQRESLPALEIQDRASRGRRDSVWNGALIGAGVGAAGGAIWGLEICGSNDTECFAIAGPVGILGGAGIGAVVGAIADALHD